MCLAWIRGYAHESLSGVDEEFGVIQLLYKWAGAVGVVFSIKTCTLLGAGVAVLIPIVAARIVFGLRPNEILLHLHTVRGAGWLGAVALAALLAVIWLCLLSFAVEEAMFHRWPTVPALWHSSQLVRNNPITVMVACGSWWLLLAIAIYLAGRGVVGLGVSLGIPEASFDLTSSSGAIGWRPLVNLSAVMVFIYFEVVWVALWQELCRVEVAPASVANQEVELIAPDPSPPIPPIQSQPIDLEAESPESDFLAREHFRVSMVRTLRWVVGITMISPVLCVLSGPPGMMLVALLMQGLPILGVVAVIWDMNLTVDLKGDRLERAKVSLRGRGRSLLMERFPQGASGTLRWQAWPMYVFGAVAVLQLGSHYAVSALAGGAGIPAAAVGRLGGTGAILRQATVITALLAMAEILARGHERRVRDLLERD